MSELTPGTPEYQEAYDAEMKRLETAATGNKAEAAPTPKETKPESKGSDDETKKPEVDELEKRLARAEKMAQDNQRYAREQSRQVAQLKKEAETRQHAESIQRAQPLLDANPGLEDAIKHVAKPEEQRPDPQKWIDAVTTAIPDAESLLGDPTFEQKAASRRQELGDEWNNPLIAIRELSEIRTTHLRDKAVQVATEAARKDFEQKSQKRDAMKVPGGSGGRGQSVEVDDAARYRDMSKADFEKERAKVMGY